MLVEVEVALVEQAELLFQVEWQVKVVLQEQEWQIQF
jgi:hypothetical protein